jgi:hypothetical protein
MRAAAIVLIALSISACSAYKAPKHATWKNTTSLEEMEKLYWQAIKDKDWGNVEAHTASSYTHSSSDGVLNKDQGMAVLKSAELVDFSLGEFQVVDNGSTSVVTYTAIFSYDYQGKRTGPVMIRRMSVWQQQKKGWSKIADADSPVSTSSSKM